MNFKKFLQKAIRSLVVFLFILFAILNIYWRVQKPDMTETRILITYWKEYLSVLGAVVILTLVELGTGKQK